MCTETVNGLLTGSIIRNGIRVSVLIISRSHSADALCFKKFVMIDCQKLSYGCKAEQKCLIMMTLIVVML